MDKPDLIIKNLGRNGPIIPNDLNDNDYRIMVYTNSVNRDLAKIANLLKKGHEITWPYSDNWCEIGGKTFNVNKYVFEKRIDEFLE